MKKTEDPPEELEVDTGRLWAAASELTSPDPYQRDQAIDKLSELEGYQDSPLIAYILITRLTEPDLEIRFHLVQLLGSLLDYGSPGQHFSDRVLKRVHYELAQLDQKDLVNLLEVSSKYLSSDRDVENILRLCSYAGDSLGGIVNDRKYPFEIRQQAVFYCGALGLLGSKPGLEILIQRVEKKRESAQRTKTREIDERLYSHAVSALSKIDQGQTRTE